MTLESAASAAGGKRRWIEVGTGSAEQRLLSQSRRLERWEEGDLIKGTKPSATLTEASIRPPEASESLREET